MLRPLDAVGFKNLHIPRQNFLIARDLEIGRPGHQDQSAKSENCPQIAHRPRKGFADFRMWRSMGNRQDQGKQEKIRQHGRVAGAEKRRHDAGQWDHAQHSTRNEKHFQSQQARQTHYKKEGIFIRGGASDAERAAHQKCEQQANCGDAHESPLFADGG